MLNYSHRYSFSCLVSTSALLKERWCIRRILYSLHNATMAYREAIIIYILSRKIFESDDDTSILPAVRAIVIDCFVLLLDLESVTYGDK